MGAVSLMKEELETRLEEFPFMKRPISENERNTTYEKWGCECSSGWYQLIYDLCQSIIDRYEEDKMSVEIRVIQIKEKMGSLRFYYDFEDSPNLVENDNETKKKLRRDIRKIVRNYKELSKTVCELCGAEAVIRMDMRRKQSLCAECYEKYQQYISKLN